jgi:hypothetical protein
VNKNATTETRRKGAAADAEAKRRKREEERRLIAEVRRERLDEVIERLAAVAERAADVVAEHESGRSEETESPHAWPQPRHRPKTGAVVCRRGRGYSALDPNACWSGLPASRQRLGLEHDLPEGLALLDEAVCLGRLRERQLAVHNRAAELALRHELDQVI